jgi:hypothetical protein
MSYSHLGHGGFTWTYCRARGKSHAIKMAAERFAQWKAQQAGIA